MELLYYDDLQRPVYALDAGDAIVSAKQKEARRKYYDSIFSERFVWIFFRCGEALYSNMSNENFARLIYAATFCHNDGSLMSRSKLRTEMRLGQRTFESFLKECYDCGVLELKNRKLYISNSFCNVGSLSKAKQNGEHMNVTRLFINAVRNLYDSCKRTSQHGKLAYLFRTIPYINRFSNAFNPTNPKEHLGKPITTDERPVIRFGEFCDVLGYDKKNARRLANDLLKIKIFGQQAICFVIFDLDITKWYLVINPRLFFGAGQDEFDDILEKFTINSCFYKELPNGSYEVVEEPTCEC